MQAGLLSGCCVLGMSFRLLSKSACQGVEGGCFLYRLGWALDLHGPTKTGREFVVTSRKILGLEMKSKGERAYPVAGQDLQMPARSFDEIDQGRARRAASRIA